MVACREIPINDGNFKLNDNFFCFDGEISDPPSDNAMRNMSNGNKNLFYNN